MADSDHTAPARPDAAPRADRKPTNPLGRPYWTFDPAGDPKRYLPAACTTLAMGIRAVTCALANSEAFRVLQETCEPTDPTQTPFDAQLTEGLFAALYMLSEQAVYACGDLQDRVEQAGDYGS